MGEVISFEDIKLRKEILELFKDGLNECSEKEKEYLVKIITGMIIPKVISKVKENKMELNAEDLKQDINFYEILFDVVGDCLIEIDPSLRTTTPELKKEVKDHLAESREIDKDRMLYDYELDYRPEVSEYEFDLKRIMNDISMYIDRKLEDSVARKK